MKIPKTKTSKIKNGAKKRLDMFMRIMFVFTALLFVAGFICILIFNSRMGKTDDSPKDTTNEQDNSANVVNIAEKIIKGNETDFEEDCILGSVDGINDDINTDDSIEFPDYSKIYSSGFSIKRIMDPPIKTVVVLDYVHNLAPRFYQYYKKARKSVDNINLIQFNYNLDIDDSSQLQKVLHLFYIISTMYELTNDKELTSWLVVEDYKSEFALLGVYLNYLTLYYMLYETAQILVLCFFDEYYFVDRIEETFKNDRIRIFALKIKNILEKTSTKLYKETKVNIGLFEDKTGTTEGMDILSIYDIDKIRNFVKFSMFHALFLIFYLDEENKIYVQEELRIYIQQKLEDVKDVESGEEDIVKVEKSCQNIYELFYDKEIKYKKSWEKDFENCVGNLKQLFEKA
eukprot:GAHX01002560.1.p1 GENE.GAHX01002560.1~~GAHX01002560.1.p1  ORF type:complete len:401 (+),score=67.63 GAHX01002560.1:284-1486(+)